MSMALSYQIHYADAATDIDHLMLQDVEHPDIANAMSTRSMRYYDDMQEYQQLDFIPYPAYIANKIPTAKVLRRYGLIPELRRAWISVDDILIIWDYASARQRIAQYDKVGSVITTVEFVHPPKGVFTKDIIGILAIGTVIDIQLVAARIVDGGASLLLLPTSLQCGLPAPARCIKSTDDGRIFVSCSNGTFAEIQYIGKCGLADSTKGCKWKKTKQPFFESLVSILPIPEVFGGNLTDPDCLSSDANPDVIDFDKNRNVCYHIRGNGRTVDVNDMNTPDLDRLITYKSLERDAEIHINKGNTKGKNKKKYKLVSLVAMNPAVSSRIFAIGFGDDGTRFMFGVDNLRSGGRRLTRAQQKNMKIQEIIDEPFITNQNPNSFGPNSMFDQKPKLRLLFPIKLNVPEIATNENFQITFAQQFMDIAMLGTMDGDVYIISNDIGALMLQNEDEYGHSPSLPQMNNTRSINISGVSERCVKVHVGGTVYKICETTPADELYSNALGNDNIYYNSWYDCSTNLINRRFDVITEKGICPIVKLCPANIIMQSLSMAMDENAFVTRDGKPNELILPLMSRIGVAETLSAAILLVVNKLSNTYTPNDPTSRTGNNNSVLYQSVNNLLVALVNKHSSMEATSGSILHKSLLLCCFRLLKPFWNRTFAEVFDVDQDTVSSDGILSSNVSALQKLHVYVTHIVTLMRFIHNMPPTLFMQNNNVFASNFGMSRTSYNPGMVQQNVDQLLYLLDYTRQIFIYTRCEGGNRTLNYTLKECLTENKFKTLTFSKVNQELSALCPNIDENTIQNRALTDIDDEEKIKLIDYLREINDIKQFTMISAMSAQSSEIKRALASIGISEGSKRSESGPEERNYLCSKKFLRVIIKDMVSFGIRSISDMKSYEDYLTARLNGRDSLVRDSKSRLNNSTYMQGNTMDVGLAHNIYVDMLICYYLKKNRRDEAAKLLLSEATKAYSSENGEQIAPFDSRLEKLVKAIAILNFSIGPETHSPHSLLESITDIFEVALVQNELIEKCERERQILMRKVYSLEDLLVFANEHHLIAEQIELLLLANENSVILNERSTTSLNLVQKWKELLDVTRGDIDGVVELLSKLSSRPSYAYNARNSAATASNGMRIRNAMTSLLKAAEEIDVDMVKQLIKQVVSLITQSQVDTRSSVMSSKALSIYIVQPIINYCSANAFTGRDKDKNQPFAAVLLECVVGLYEYSLLPTTELDYKMLLNSLNIGQLARRASPMLDPLRFQSLLVRARPLLQSV